MHPSKRDLTERDGRREDEVTRLKSRDAILDELIYEKRHNELLLSKR